MIIWLSRGQLFIYVDVKINQRVGGMGKERRDSLQSSSITAMQKCSNNYALAYNIQTYSVAKLCPLAGFYLKCQEVDSSLLYSTGSFSPLAIVHGI